MMDIREIIKDLMKMLVLFILRAAKNLMKLFLNPCNKLSAKTSENFNG